MRHPRISVWISVAVVVMLAGRQAHAGATGEIRAVEVSETAEVTRIKLRAASSLAFTVYKLERPTRVVIDVPKARIADALASHDSSTVLTPNTWAVSTIAAQQIEDTGNLVRVSVTLARPGRYDVKSEGNDIIVIVIVALVWGGASMRLLRRN
jgi:hypothetical protein